MKDYRKTLCIAFIVLAVLILFLGGYFGLWQFSELLPYILAALIGGIPPALLYIFKPSDKSKKSEQQFSDSITRKPAFGFIRQKKDQKPIVIQTRMPDVKLIDNLPQPAVLQYGKIRVKRRSQKSYGGVLDSLYYYTEIINTNASTIALNCRGDIRLDGNTHSTIWEKNRSDIISIAHRELLFLFEVLVFTKDSVRETRLYLKWGVHQIDARAMTDYDDKINKEITVLVHSENVRYPTESQSLRKTIQQIMSEARAD